jgi:tetratricopeptide (TPR) repeat protein
MKNCIFFILTILFIILLCYKVDTYSQDFLCQKDASGLNSQLFYKTFGEFREYLSDLSYLQADAYFHSKGRNCEQGLEAHDEYAVETKHQHALPELAIKQIFPNHLLNISQAIQINGHRHLSVNEQKEIIPWFYYAIKLNPHNESAYCIGGFWLANHLGKIDEAIEFLKQGLEHNPDSWKICAELGETYFMNKKDYPNANYYFKQAKLFSETQTVDKFNQRIIYTFLAESYKKLGELDKAEEIYTKLDKIFSK